VLVSGMKLGAQNRGHQVAIDIAGGGPNNSGCAQAKTEQLAELSGVGLELAGRDAKHGATRYSCSTLRISKEHDSVRADSEIVIYQYFNGNSLAYITRHVWGQVT